MEDLSFPDVPHQRALAAWILRASDRATLEWASFRLPPSQFTVPTFNQVFESALTVLQRSHVPDHELSEQITELVLRGRAAANGKQWENPLTREQVDVLVRTGYVGEPAPRAWTLGVGSEAAEALLPAWARPLQPGSPGQQATLSAARASIAATLMQLGHLGADVPDEFRAAVQPEDEVDEETGWWADLNTLQPWMYGVRGEPAMTAVEREQAKWTAVAFCLQFPFDGARILAAGDLTPEDMKFGDGNHNDYLYTLMRFMRRAANDLMGRKVQEPLTPTAVYALMKSNDALGSDSQAILNRLNMAAAGGLRKPEAQRAVYQLAFEARTAEAAATLTKSRPGSTAVGSTDPVIRDTTDKLIESIQAVHRAQEAGTRLTKLTPPVLKPQPPTLPRGARSTPNATRTASTESGSSPAPGA